MKKLLVLVMVWAIVGWAIPKPMESIENYNVMIVHGAYGSEKGFLDEKDTNEAYYAEGSLENGATLGAYDNSDRITNWLSTKILEEPGWTEKKDYVKKSYVYNWRSFSNPANTSLNNAHEMGDRTWILKDTKYKHRRTLFEEAQEVKAVYDTLRGQAALEIMRQNSDLYRQIPSRYILIGHSMGGVVAREYVQGDFYNGDVDKIITLDSPHEGTGALNMLIEKSTREEALLDQARTNFLKAAPLVAGLATTMFLSKGVKPAIYMGIFTMAEIFAIEEVGNALTYAFAPQIYYYDDPLVHYVDPLQQGYGTIDSLNKLDFEKKVDVLPMFRILASKNGMTFTDPKLVDLGVFNFLGYLLPDNFIFPIANFGAQLMGTGDWSARTVNAFVSSFIGFSGMPMQDNGSSIVPAASSEGRNVGVLNDSRVDVKREYFNAAPAASGEVATMLGDFTSVGDLSSILEAASVAMFLIDAFAWTGVSDGAKIALGVGTAVVASSYLGAALSTGIYDLVKSHSIPLQKNYLDDMKAAKNTFSPIDSSEGSSYTPYLMEDFLYEKPFVNLLLGDAHTLEMIDNDTTHGKTATAKLNKSCFYIGSRDSAKCVVGFFGDSVQNTSVAENISVSKLEPLKFHSSQDWNEFGVKVDRWEMVDGLHPDGSDNLKGVPIRHVERYKLPKIVATDYIHRYSFVVDDLMPHRLREITMNFNFQTEIKWACNVKIDPKLDTACTVYADKNDGNGLQPIGKVPHPVEKNGDFIFVPANLPDPAFKNPAYFQKDNQNTVTISTVNKIGLSNTQRFFYLAKMTEDLYEAKWPLPNIVVTGVDNFKLTASTLDYQGFRIDSLSTDSIFVDTAFTKDSAVVANARFTDLRMGFSSDGKGATLTSAQKNSNVPEGHYIWKINISVANDTSAAVVPYSVPFSVDRTPPQVSLSRESGRLNPNRTNILARVVNVDSMLDIRAMRVYLSKWNGNRFEFHAKLPSLYDVSNPNFAIFRDSSIRLDDGKYRLNIFAIDRALPDYDAYEKVAGLVNKIVAGNDTESDWNSIESLALNKTRDFVEFYVDTTPPVFTFSNVRAERSNSEPSLFTLPQKVDTLLYIGADDRLKMSYNVKENNIDSASVVKLYYSFMHWPDTSAADRMGDSVTIVSANGYNGDWLENDHMLISDGDYRIKVTAVDGADNESEKKYDKVVRVDRISPNIETLVSTKLVYPKDETVFGAKLVVNEKHDAAENRTGFRCYSRVRGAEKTSAWKYINKAFVDDTVRFEIMASDVDTTTGKRYLEVGCADAAGNISYMTDLFYVGTQYPEITSPTDTTKGLDGAILAIKGVAAAPSAKYEITARYELSYKCLNPGCDNSWHTEGISRRDSNRTQPIEGVLGFWNRKALSGNYMLKLDMIPCDTCAILSDSTRIYLATYVPDSSDPLMNLQVQDTVYVDSIKSKILYSMQGDNLSNYSVRVYGYDAKGVALFDAGTNRIKGNPFYGNPVDESKTQGIWFYGDSVKWTLKWKGLKADSLVLRYDSTSTVISCVVANKCEKRLDSISSVTSPSLLDSLTSLIPEMNPIVNANAMMILTGESGNVTIQSNSAFSVNQAIDTLTVLPVYFGSRSESGFPGAGAVPVYSWSVDRENYMFKKEWNGLSDAGTYPAEGFATIYAEAVEKQAVGSARVFLDSAKVFLALPGLKVVLPSDTLPPFKLFKLPKTVSALPDSVSYVVGKMSADYGIRGRKAYVNAYVTAPDGNKIDVFKNELKNAGPNNAAYTLVWNGMKEKDHPVTNTGTYTLTIKAVEAYPVDTENVQVDSVVVPFELVVANNLNLVELKNENSNGLWFNIREAVEDTMHKGEKRYEPIADYLVTADVSGYYLPEEYQKPYELKSTITGTQNAIGFKPERFSLGIKRQRETLRLVLVYKFDRWIQSVSQVACDNDDERTEPIMDAKIVDFSSMSKEISFPIYTDAPGRYGYNYDLDANFDAYAVLYKDWVSFTSQGINLYEGDYEKIKEKAVWKLTDISDSLNNFIPRPRWGGYRVFEPLSMGTCKADSSLTDGLVKQCQCDSLSGCRKGRSNDYNPNRNLFKVELIGDVEGNNFYTKEERIKCGWGGQVKFRNMKFDIKFSIPDSYWNAGFGYDNLVNRTIRFDGTNKSIYNAGTSGYMAALQDSVLGRTSLGSAIRNRANNFFDGDKWTFDKSYGKLTPYETQHLPFFGADVLSGAPNAFLFPDEMPDTNLMYPSYYEVKFYNDDSENWNMKHYVAMVHGYQNGSPVKRFLNSSVKDSLRTPLLDHGSVDFYVSLNKSFGAQIADTVKYVIPNPAPRPNVWKDSVKNDSVKFYAMGSKVHYYPGDFKDADWLNLYLTSSDSTGFFKNLLNFIDTNGINNPIIHYLAAYWKPDSLLTLGIDSSKVNDSTNFSTTVSFDKDKYNSVKHAFYVTPFGLPVNASAGMKYDYTFPDSVHWKHSNDTLYYNADSLREALVYRRTKANPLSELPTPVDSTVLSVGDLVKYGGLGQNRVALMNGEWFKERRVGSAELTHLDGSEHSHFIVDMMDSLANNLTVRYRDSVLLKRPHEYVEMVGRLTSGINYDISYLKDSVFHYIGSFTGTGKSEHLKWFDMNHLQGNTSFILTWGSLNGSSNMNYAQYDLNVGTPVGTSDDKTVKSLFGEVSVSFGSGAMDIPRDVTVRTTSAEEHQFDVFNNAALTGPIIEVLPSMEFTDSTKYPRIQMKLSRKEIEQAGLTPDRVRLYKVDFKNGQFVPLSHVLYGYLNDKGKAAVGGTNADSDTCSRWNDPVCYDASWAYMLISGETATFSVFAALDSVKASTKIITMEILPEVAVTLEREIRIVGSADFDLYLDSALSQKISWRKDSLGRVMVTLPNQDSTYIYGVARNASGEEGFDRPVKALAIVVPPNLVCNIPLDTLWLGLDNGYMELYPNCNQPGFGVFTLYKGTKGVANKKGNLQDTLRFDGEYGGLKIKDGVYASRYEASSLVSTQAQFVGPVVITDSARPIITEERLEESSNAIDRHFDISFNVVDDESGIYSVKLCWILGQDTLGTTSVLPDSLGNVSVSKIISRYAMDKCLGCNLTASVEVQDYGHNLATRRLVSEELWPYPMGIALWYPASEGSGKTAKERIGTGHHLNLSMFRPWLSGSGLYFYHPGDSAVGAGRVDLGTSSEYSMEARVSPGNAQDTLWRRVMGFVGTSGMKIEVQNQGRNLRLVENNRIWTLRGYLPPNAWSHVVVAVDSQDVRFYIDGAMVKRMPALPMEREFYGTFSMGELESKNFVGHVADVRFYTKALNGDEVLALTLPITDESDTTEIHTIIVLGNEMEGAGRQFSCAVSGNGYFVGSDAGTGLNMSVDIPASADYKAIVYARSAIKTSAVIKIGAQGATTYSGSIKLENTWRPVEIANVKIPLNSGMQRITLNVPDGVQIAGVAFTNGDEVKPSQISWKSNSEIAGNETVVVQKVKSSVRFEGYPSDKTMIRPRIRLKNISSETINGFKVRYYFRGESPESVNADAYFPGEDSLGLVVSAEGYNTGYVEWAFDTTRILPGGRPYFGDGPLMGIYNDGNVPWYAEDDPSYVLPGMAATDVDGFIDDFGIVVLDSENNLIGGHCVEMEDPIEATPPSVRVFAADLRDDQTRASEIALKLENLGGASLRKYDVRYYFLVEEGLQPIFDINYQPLFVDGAEMVALGNSRYQVNVHVGDVSLAPHNVWADEFKFAIHVGNWDPLWNASDDPSHEGLTKSYVVTSKICVYDSTGNKIYGDDPVWEEPKIVAPRDNQDSLVADYGYDSGISIPVIRTPEGLILSLDGYPYVLLDLVYANGAPIRRIYSGTVMPGEQFIAVDWTGIDLSHTYLVLRKNSQIVSTKLLSNL
ncbi:MAG: hypothetical protein J6P30_03630 [Fibrobacter sp.]|nr:hypothetical protein [Fibrobacter sp.]